MQKQVVNGCDGIEQHTFYWSAAIVGNSITNTWSDDSQDPMNAIYFLSEFSEWNTLLYWFISQESKGNKAAHVILFLIESKYLSEFLRIKSCFEQEKILLTSVAEVTPT